MKKLILPAVECQKRLNLDAFKTKCLGIQQATDQLLGQVLGDCHDTPDSDPSSEDPGPDIDAVIL